MRYVSTRGQAPELDFADVLLAGLAEDGGLYVPASWPVFSAADWRALRGLPYAELAARVIAPFVAPVIPFADLQAMCRRAYAGFGHKAVVPLVQLDSNICCAGAVPRADLGVQGSGAAACRAFVRLRAGAARPACADRGRDVRRYRLGGDRGDGRAAAIVDIAILHPAGKTSEVQRRQMTTVQAANVLNIAVEGNFDDCQDLVKAMFADAPFRREMGLSAVNSINWARIAAQIPYYAAAALTLGAPDREVAVAVPTGNFGNVLAAWVARQMGLPIGRFIVASNRNDILNRFLAHNDMSVRDVAPSFSPSMDIGVSSNFERLLYAFLGRDAAATAQTMQHFRATGKMAVAAPVWQAVRREFTGFTLSDADTLAEIARTYRENRLSGGPAYGHRPGRGAGSRTDRVAGDCRGDRASGEISGCDREGRRLPPAITSGPCRPI